MHRFKSILAVVTEDSLYEVALARALHLAKVNDAALTLVDVIDATPGELGRLLAALPGRRSPEIEEDVVAYHRDRLTAMADTARAQGIAVSEVALQGTPFLEVIRMVLREGHDIVIKGGSDAGHGRGTMRGFDMHLLRKCPCPVWLLMGANDGHFDTILATVDPAPTGDAARDGLDRLVMDLATSLAARDGATTHVAHAWHLQEEQALRNGRHTAAFADEVDRLLDRERDNAQARLQALLADYPQVAADDVHLIKGNPGAVIADHATAMAADLIVMGTVGRTGLAGLIMGNTAETILGQVRCSVIAVKPDGFICPITLDQTG